MDVQEIYKRPAPERISTVLGLVDLGKGCKVSTVGNVIEVNVPKICPGKLLKQVAELTKIGNTQVAVVPVTVGQETREITLDYAIEKAPGGCGAMFGGRATNLKVLSNLFTVIANVPESGVDTTEWKVIAADEPAQ